MCVLAPSSGPGRLRLAPGGLSPAEVGWLIKRENQKSESYVSRAQRFLAPMEGSKLFASAVAVAAANEAEADGAAGPSKGLEVQAKPGAKAKPSAKGRAKATPQKGKKPLKALRPRGSSLPIPTRLPPKV